jgi:hypothetical protein
MTRSQNGIPSSNCLPRLPGNATPRRIMSPNMLLITPVPMPQTTAFFTLRLKKLKDCQSFESPSQARGNPMPMTTTRLNMDSTFRLKILRTKKVTNTIRDKRLFDLIFCNQFSSGPTTIICHPGEVKMAYSRHPTLMLRRAVFLRRLKRLFGCLLIWLAHQIYCSKNVFRLASIVSQFVSECSRASSVSLLSWERATKV